MDIIKITSNLNEVNDKKEGRQLLKHNIKVLDSEYVAHSADISAEDDNAFKPADYYIYYLNGLYTLLNELPDREITLKFMYKYNFCLFDIGLTDTFERDTIISKEEEDRVFYARGNKQVICEQLLFALFVSFIQEDFLTAFYGLFKDRYSYINIPIGSATKEDGILAVHECIVDPDQKHLKSTYKILLTNPDFVSNIESSPAYDTIPFSYIAKDNDDAVANEGWVLQPEEKDMELNHLLETFIYD